MQELMWINRFPGGKLEAGIELLDKLYWHISTEKRGDHWYIWSGESLIFKSDSQEAVDAFLYGITLTYVVLPEPVFEKHREEIKRWVE